MAYDTSLPLVKNYVWLMREWAEESLAWSKVGVGYHHPGVENLPNSLSGLAAAVKKPNPKYLGWAVYSEWTLDEQEKELLRNLP